MKAGILLAGYLCAITFSINGQTLRDPIAAPYSGAGAYSYHFSDVMSAGTHQAALARLPSMAAGVYAERRFMQDVLNSFTASIGMPVHGGGIGITAGYYGSSAYNESQIGLAYGRKLGLVDLGAHFGYNMMRAAGYGNDGAAVIEAGMIWHVTDQVHTGFQLSQPASGKYGKDKQEYRPRSCKMGIGYEVGGYLLIAAEMVKEEERDMIVHASVQYTLEKRFFLRGGINTTSTAPWLSAGWGWKNIRTDITASYHPQLGLTPGLMMVFATHKEPKP